MEKFFRYLGHKAGPSIRKGKWIYNSLFSDKDSAIESEYLVGRELAAKMNQELEFLENPSVGKSVSLIGNKLNSGIKNKKRQFNFRVIDSKDLNAFALPGGFIYITSNLLTLCNFNHDEIAFILSHEMIHVVSRHPLKIFLSNFTLSSVERIIKTKGVLGQLSKQTLSNFMRSSYAQDNEFDADRFAIKLMDFAGYDTKAAVSVLTKLEAHKSKPLETFNYFSSHPGLRDRISRIDAIIASDQA